MKVDSAVIDFPCPNCAKYIHQSIAEIKTTLTISCTCGQTISIDKQELKAAIKVMRKMLKKADENAETEAKPLMLFAPDELEKTFDQLAYRKLS